MKGRLIPPLLFLFMIIGSLPALAVSAEICNRIVAIVNEDVITLYELNKKMENVLGHEPTILKKQDNERFLEIRRQVLDHLIDEKIAREKIRELEITVKEKEVDAAIERIKQDNSLTHEDLLASLKKEGISYERYWEKVKGELERIYLIDREVKSKIVISEDEMAQYYREHLDEFEGEGRVHIAAIFLKKNVGSDQKEAQSLLPKAEEIVRRARNGEDFSKLAKEFSEGPGAQDGGDLGFFKTSELDPKLREIIMGLSHGQVSDPIPLPFGIEIVKLLEKQGGTAKSFEDAKDAIYRQLYREEINKRYEAWIKELRSTAYTKIIF